MSQREITCPHDAVQDWTITWALRDRSPAAIERSSLLKPCTTAQALQVGRIVVPPPVATLWIDEGVHDDPGSRQRFCEVQLTEVLRTFMEDCADANLVFVRIVDGKISEPVCAVADGAVKFHACLHQLVV